MWGVRKWLLQALLAAQLYPKSFSVVRKVTIYTAVFLSPGLQKDSFVALSNGCLKKLT